MTELDDQIDDEGKYLDTIGKCNCKPSLLFFYSKKVNSESNHQEEEEADCDTCTTDSEVENEDDAMNVQCHEISGIMATIRAELEHEISVLRKTLEKSQVELAKAKSDAATARTYAQVLERRQNVVEKMVDEWGDQVYCKFEQMMWLDLFQYFNSGQSQIDKDALVQSLKGLKKLILSFEFNIHLYFLYIIL